MSPVILFLLQLTISSTFGIITIEVEDKWNSCMPDYEFHLLDMDNLTFISNRDEGMVYYNGTMKVLMDIQGKIALNFTAERLRHGRWESSEFKFYTPDFCSFINNPVGQPMIYMMVHKSCKQKSCPFKTGVRVRLKFL